MLNSGPRGEFSDASLRAKGIAADPPGMALESEDPFANETGTAGAPARSMLSGYCREGREEIVRDRLRRLLAVLGDVPFQRSITAPNWGNTLGQLLDDTCPPGTMVMHGRRVPDRVPDSGLRLEHLAVAPRGLVVIGPYLGHAPAGAASHRDALGKYKSANGVGSSAFPRGQVSARRSGPVRETLRRSRRHAFLVGRDSLGGGARFGRGMFGCGPRADGKPGSGPGRALARAGQRIACMAGLGKVP